MIPPAGAKQSFGMDLLESAFIQVQKGIFTVQSLFHQALDVVGSFMNPTLEDTLVEKIGEGPHGYGDPSDMSIREVEQYLFPRMVWKKVRYEKCFEIVEKFYACVNKNNQESDNDCKKLETEMFKCKDYYYSPAKIDEIEKECIIEYIKLRSEFRKTGSEDDLWKMKMLMLEPGYDKLRQVYKENESFERMRVKSSKSTT